MKKQQSGIRRSQNLNTKMELAHREVSKLEDPGHYNAMESLSLLRKRSDLVLNAFTTQNEDGIIVLKPEAERRRIVRIQQIGGFRGGFVRISRGYPYRQIPMNFHSEVEIYSQKTPEGVRRYTIDPLNDGEMQHLIGVSRSANNLYDQQYRMDPSWFTGRVNKFIDSLVSTEKNRRQK